MRVCLLYVRANLPKVSGERMATFLEIKTKSVNPFLKRFLSMMNCPFSWRKNLKERAENELENRVNYRRILFRRYPVFCRNPKVVPQQHPSV